MFKKSCKIVEWYVDSGVQVTTYWKLNKKTRAKVLDAFEALPNIIEVKDYGDQGCVVRISGDQSIESVMNAIHAMVE